MSREWYVLVARNPSTVGTWYLKALEALLCLHVSDRYGHCFCCCLFRFMGFWYLKALEIFRLAPPGTDATQAFITRASSMLLSEGVTLVRRRRRWWWGPGEGGGAAAAAASHGGVAAEAGG